MKVETAAAASTATATAPAVAVARADKDLAHWRKMAVEAGQRIEILETQAKDLRAAADDARARFSKYKTRLDNAQARINELEVERIKLSTSIDEYRVQVARQAELAKQVHEFRQSIIDGPLWKLFVELSVSPADAGRGAE